jgi:hypothetical protein
VPDDDRTPRQRKNVLHDASSGLRGDRLGGSLSAGSASCTAVLDIVQGAAAAESVPLGGTLRARVEGYPVLGIPLTAPRLSWVGC